MRQKSRCVRLKAGWAALWNDDAVGQGAERGGPRGGPLGDWGWQGGGGKGVANSRGRTRARAPGNVRTCARERHIQELAREGMEQGRAWS